MSEQTASIAQDEQAGAAAQREGPRHLTVEEYPTTLRLSEALRKFVDFVGRFGSWFIVPLVIIT